MDMHDRITYFPSTDESFDEATVDPFTALVTGRLDFYLTEHQRNDLPLSLLEFAVDLIYQVGHDAAMSEVSTGEMQRQRGLRALRADAARREQLTREYAAATESAHVHCGLAGHTDPGVACDVPHDVVTMMANEWMRQHIQNRRHAVKFNMRVSDGDETLLLEEFDPDEEPLAMLAEAHREAHANNPPANFDHDHWIGTVMTIEESGALHDGHVLPQRPDVCELHDRHGVSD